MYLHISIVLSIQIYLVHNSPQNVCCIRTSCKILIRLCKPVQMTPSSSCHPGKYTLLKAVLWILNLSFTKIYDLSSTWIQCEWMLGLSTRIFWLTENLPSHETFSCHFLSFVEHCIKLPVHPRLAGARGVVSVTQARTPGREVKQSRGP